MDTLHSKDDDDLPNPMNHRIRFHKEKNSIFQIVNKYPKQTISLFLISKKRNEFSDRGRCLPVIYYFHIHKDILFDVYEEK